MAYSTQTCNTISVNLDETNYPTWAYQLQHYLRGHGFLKFMDGSHLCPPLFLVGDDSSLINNSAAREKWMEQDSLVIFMITTTLSTDALSLVIGCQTSMEVWLTLKQRYAFVSESHIMQLKAALHNIRKGYDSIDKYLLRFKYMRDRLAVAGVEMNDQDAKFFILAGLPVEYGHTRQIIRGKHDIAMDEVRSLLLSAEYEIELKNKAYLSSLSTMIAQCGSVCPASQNVQFSMPSNIPQIQGLYNCGYMNGNPVSFCLPIYVAAQSQSMCSPSGVLLNNNNLGSGNYFSNARAYSYAPQISKSMNQNGRSENGGYSFVQSNMLSSVGNHGVTQNGINLFASSGFTNVHQYNTSPATTQYGFVSPHNTMNASTGFATPPTSASSPTSSDIVPQNGRFMGVPSSPSFQPIFTSGAILFNGSKQLQTYFQNYNAGFGAQNGDNASQPPSETECDDYFARCLTDEMDDLKEYSGHAAEPCVINPVLTDPSYMDKPSLLLTQAQIDRIKLRDSISVAESGKFHKGGVRSLKTYEAGLETRPITSIPIPKALSASIFTQPVPPSIASQLSSCLALPDNNFFSNTSYHSNEGFTRTGSNSSCVGS